MEERLDLLVEGGLAGIVEAEEDDRVFFLARGQAIEAFGEMIHLGLAARESGYGRMFDGCHGVYSFADRDVRGELWGRDPEPQLEKEGYAALRQGSSTTETSGAGYELSTL